MAPQSYQLVMRSGPNPGKAWDLDTEEISIGRDISNDIVISDAEVSRHHARLRKQGNTYMLEDQGSTNGTFVDGQRLMGPHLLRPGEMILLGENVSLIYEPVAYEAGAVGMGQQTPDLPPVPPTPRPEEVMRAQREPVYERSQPPVQPVYSGSVPPGPVETYPAPPPEQRSSRTWIYAGCGCLVLLLCIILGAAFAFDALNLYCTPPFDALFACP